MYTYVYVYIIWYSVCNQIVHSTFLFLSTVCVGASMGLALVFSLLLFVFWFFTGWYYVFVILFGLCMGGLISATILLSPIGKSM